MKIIGFCGPSGAGKDTAASCLIVRGWTRLAFADPLREMLIALNPIIDDDGYTRLSDVVKKEGWDRAKQREEVRRLLRRLGTQAGRHILGQDVWVRLLQETINKIYNKFDGYDRFVITDVRFENEARMILQAGGKILEICRGSVTYSKAHESEYCLPELYISAAIGNHGTKNELWDKVILAAGETGKEIAE